MPHAHAITVSLSVHVVTVSSSRGAAEDQSGPLLRSLAEGAGHAIAGHAILPDDAEAIGAELDRALNASTIDVILLTGGTGISGKDGTSAVVRARLDREIPGFGELFRAISFADIGSAAMLSSAIGGVAKGKIVFAIPGSPAACRLAMQRLILPELGHISGELRKETPEGRRPSEAVRPVVRGPTRGVPDGARPEAALASPTVIEPPRRGTDIVQMNTEVTPVAQEVAPGWQAAVSALGGQLSSFGSAALPESLTEFPAVMDVLNTASARMKLACGDGRNWLVFGYPDLLRPGSKVIAIREGLPIAEVVALHRWPARVGVCTELEDSFLPSFNANVAEVSQARCGRPCDQEGSLFAVEAGAVWIQSGSKVRKWDGKRLGQPESAGATLGSLLLNWSQR